MDGALEAGGKAVEALLATLARESGREGRIDTALMDRYQTEVFQVSQAYAALRSAEAVHAYGRRGEVENLLAQAFCGRTLADLSGRLALPALHLPQAGAAAQAFAADAQVAGVIRETTD